MVRSKASLACSTRPKSTRFPKKKLSMRPLKKRLLQLKKRRLVREQKEMLQNRLLLREKLRKSLLSILKISLGPQLIDIPRIWLSFSYKAVQTVKVLAMKLKRQQRLVALKTSLFQRL